MTITNSITHPETLPSPRLPAEWEPHTGTLMSWPSPQNWQGFSFAEVEDQWMALANTIAQYEPVYVLCPPDRIERLQRKADACTHFVPAHPGDGWARDSLPLFVTDGENKTAACHFVFNGWGNKQPCGDNRQLKSTIGKRLGIKHHRSQLVLEGGALDGNGQGIALTTQQCLLTRNPSWDQQTIAAELRKILGIQKLVWLPKGIAPDEWTDGHVDGLCRFVDSRNILLSWCDHPSDPNYAICRQAEQVLQEELPDYRIHHIPLGFKVSYINYVHCNGALIVPLEMGSTDAVAMEILRELHPGLLVLGMDSRMAADGGGGFHCMTMQVCSGVDLAKLNRPKYTEAGK